MFVDLAQFLPQKTKTLNRSTNNRIRVLLEFLFSIRFFGSCEGSSSKLSSHIYQFANTDCITVNTVVHQKQHTKPYHIAASCRSIRGAYMTKKKNSREMFEAKDL